MDPAQQALVLQADIRLLERKRQKLLTDIDQLNRAKSSIPTNSAIVREKQVLEQDIRVLTKQTKAIQDKNDSMSRDLLKRRGELITLGLQIAQQKRRYVIARRLVDSTIKTSEKIRNKTDEFGIQQVHASGEMTKITIDKANALQRRAQKSLELAKVREAELEKKAQLVDTKENQSVKRISEARIIEKNNNIEKKQLEKRAISIQKLEKKTLDVTTEAQRYKKETVDEYVKAKKARENQETILKRLENEIHNKLQELKRRESAVLHTQQLNDQRKADLDRREKYIKDREALLRHKTKMAR